MDLLGASGQLLSWAGKPSSIASSSARNSSREVVASATAVRGNVVREGASVSAPSTRTDEIRDSIEAGKESNSDFQLIKKTFGDSRENATKAGDVSSPSPAHESPPDTAKATSGKADDEETPVGPPVAPPPSAKTSTSLASSQRSSTSATAKTEVKQSDPLMLDLNGNGIETSGLGEGAVFDINGDGAPDRASFAAGGDGVLALDRNGNGVIDDGKELFGDQNGAQNGYAELARYDQNGDGWIDAKDPVFKDLVLLAGKGADTLRVSDATTLASAGVKAIGLKYGTATGKTSGGDDIAQTGVFIKTDGTAGETADVLFSHISVYT